VGYILGRRELIDDILVSPALVEHVAGAVTTDAAGETSLIDDGPNLRRRVTRASATRPNLLRTEERRWSLSVAGEKDFIDFTSKACGLTPAIPR
jgi:hypothetical protein